MNQPDFSALRAERNRKIEAAIEKLRAEGFEVGRCMHRDPDACYCDCVNGGPCEHKWDGKAVEMESVTSVTCSRCGMLAFSHDLRVMP